MIRRSVVAVAILAVVGSSFAAPRASASIPRCGFILFAHRINASDTLFAAQRNSTHDIFDFVHAMFAATRKSDIENAFTKDLGALNTHFGDALIALRNAGKAADAEFTKGACTGSSSSAKTVESMFYARMELQLEGSDALALATLARLHQIALRTCC